MRIKLIFDDEDHLGKKVAHLVCVVRGGKGDPQEVRVVLHSEKRRR